MWDHVFSYFIVKQKQLQIIISLTDSGINVHRQGDGLMLYILLLVMFANYLTLSVTCATPEGKQQATKRTTLLLKLKMYLGLSIVGNIWNNIKALLTSDWG